MIKLNTSLIGAFIYVFTTTFVFAVDPPISLEEIGGIFGYPADKLAIQDITEQVNLRAEARGRDRVMSSHVVSGTGNSFARVSIDIAAGGALLTPKLVLEVEQSIAKTTASGLQSPLKWLTLGEAGYGVSGLGIVGPGGSQERVAITLKSQRRDIQITITIPGDPPLEILSGAENYHQLVTGGGIREPLIECLNTVARKATGQPIKAVVSETRPAMGVIPPAQPDIPATLIQDNVTTQPQSDQKRQPVVSESKLTTSPLAPTGNAQSKSPSPILWCVITAAALCLIAWFLLRRRKL